MFLEDREKKLNALFKDWLWLIENGHAESGDMYLSYRDITAFFIEIGPPWRGYAVEMEKTLKTKALDDMHGRLMENL
jgi:hypothetical protein